MYGKKLDRSSSLLSFPSLQTYMNWHKLQLLFYDKLSSFISSEKVFHIFPCSILIFIISVEVECTYTQNKWPLQTIKNKSWIKKIVE